MTSPSEPHEIFASWPQRLGWALVTMLPALLPAGVLGETSAEWLGVALTLLLLIVLPVRCLRLGVTIDDETCTVRNVFRTVDVPLDLCDRFEFGQAWYSRIDQYTVALHRHGGRRVLVTGLWLPVFPPLQDRGIERLARMNEALQRRRRSRDLDGA